MGLSCQYMYKCKKELGSKHQQIGCSPLTRITRMALAYSLNPNICIAVTFGNHLHGEMYELAIKSHKNYTTRCVCSGEATGTGKSLLQSVWMDVFRPEDAICVASITQAMAYQMLNDGENIYGR